MLLVEDATDTGQLKLTRIDQSLRRLSLRCTRCNSRIRGFIRIT